MDQCPEPNLITMRLIELIPDQFPCTIGAAALVPLNWSNELYVLILCFRDFTSLAFPLQAKLSGSAFLLVLWCCRSCEPHLRSLASISQNSWRKRKQKVDRECTIINFQPIYVYLREHDSYLSGIYLISTYLRHLGRVAMNVRWDLGDVQIQTYNLSRILLMLIVMELIYKTNP